MTLSLEPREQLCLSNALNEVCHGFRVDDFDRRLGISKEEMSRLHDAFNEKMCSEAIEIVLTLKEAAAMRNALVETIGELGIEEFSTRVGIPFAEGRTILESLDLVLGESPT